MTVWLSLTETNGAIAASRTLTFRDPDQPSSVDVSVLTVAAPVPRQFRRGDQCRSPVDAHPLSLHGDQPAGN